MNVRKEKKKIILHLLFLLIHFRNIQGKWEVMNGAVSFDNGEVVMTSGSTSLYGVYEINTLDSTIDLTIKATDGNVGANLPYTYENGSLCIYNNNNEPMTKVDDLKSK